MYQKRLTIILLVLSTGLFAQSPLKAPAKLGVNPVFFIDSVNLEKSEFIKFDPKNIASLTIYEGKEVVGILGDKGKDGAVYVESIPFAKKRFQRFFKTKSKEFENLVPTLESDSTIQYILNDKVLVKDYEGNLSAINDETFKEIKIITKEDLVKDYGISDKSVGVLIRSRVPKNLYNGNKKF